jgi:hypothetical protein
MWLRCDSVNQDLPHGYDYIVVVVVVRPGHKPEISAAKFFFGL